MSVGLLLLLLESEDLDESSSLGSQTSEDDGSGGDGGQGGSCGSGENKTSGGGEGSRADRLWEEEWLRHDHAQQADGVSDSE